MRNFRIRQLLTAAVLLLCAKSLCAAEPGGTGRDGTLHTTADTVTVAPTINELRELRGLTSKSTLFVPKGQWIFGGTVSYSTHTNDNYSFLIIEGIRRKPVNREKEWLVNGIFFVLLMLLMVFVFYNDISNLFR